MALPKLDALASGKPIVIDACHIKIGSKYLATNRFGCFSILEGPEYRMLARGELSDALYSRLERDGLIVTDRNRQGIIQKEQAKARTLFQGTSLHIIVPTLRCNHRCVYCHAASKPLDSEGFDMTEETVKKTVDLIFQSPSRHIHIEFQGGEPLLNFPIVKSAIGYAKKLNLKQKKSLRFSLVTNLTLMNDEMLDYLMREKVGICTSVDGPKHIHDAARKYLEGDGSYDQVVYWVEKIKEKYPELLNVLTVVTKLSTPYPEEVVEELSRLGFTKIFIKPMNFLGFATSTWKKLGFAPEEYIGFYRKAIDYIVNSNKKTRDVFTTFVLMKVLDRTEPGYLDLQNPCGAAIGQLCYNYDGKVYSCDEGRMIPDDVFLLGTVDQSYKQILSSPETCHLVHSAINDIYSCNSCVFKPYCGLCPVCTYSSQGTLIPNLTLDSRCRILKGVFTYIFEMLEKPKHRAVFEEWVRISKVHK
ncbi:MAG: His-Xaa-Ser system radical SAM maturase HxsB [Candidatus Woesearchaeota archaeon]